MNQHKFLITLIALITKQALDPKLQTYLDIGAFSHYLGQLEIRLIRSIWLAEGVCG